MSSSSLSSNKFINRALINRAQINNLKVNDLRINEISEISENNQISNKKIDDNKFVLQNLVITNASISGNQITFYEKDFTMYIWGDRCLNLGEDFSYNKKLIGNEAVYNLLLAYDNEFFDEYSYKINIPNIHIVVKDEDYFTSLKDVSVVDDKVTLYLANSIGNVTETKVRINIDRLPEYRFDSLRMEGDLIYLTSNTDTELIISNNQNNPTREDSSKIKLPNKKIIVSSQFNKSEFKCVTFNIDIAYKLANTNTFLIINEQLYNELRTLYINDFIELYFNTAEFNAQQFTFNSVSFNENYNSILLIKNDNSFQFILNIFKNSEDFINSTNINKYNIEGTLVTIADNKTVFKLSQIYTTSTTSRTVTTIYFYIVDKNIFNHYYGEGPNFSPPFFRGFLNLINFLPSAQTVLTISKFL